jgi:hypothetical protein
MLTLEQHMVDLTDLRDIAKAGAQQRPGELRDWLCGYYVERHGPSRLDDRYRRKLQSLRFIGAAHLCALTRSAVAVKFWCRRYVMAISSSWTKLRTWGACKRHAANTSLT